MTVVISILAAIVILGILIAVHEFGHFLAGRLFGFTILEYSIGMGPKIFGKKKNGTLFALRALPIGGMCKFYGEDEEVPDTDGTAAMGDLDAGAVSAEEDPDAPKMRYFNSHPAWQRLIVVLAGPIFNFVFAILFCFLLVGIFGTVYSVNWNAPAIAGYTDDTSRGKAAGIMEGDLVIKIDDTTVATAEEMIAAVKAADKEKVHVTVLRPDDDTVYAINGDTIGLQSEIANYLRTHDDEPEYTLSVASGAEELTLEVTDIYDAKEGYNRIGVSINTMREVERVHYGVFGVISESFDYIGTVMKAMFEFLGDLFTGQISFRDVAGIVGIVDVVDTGVDAYVEQEQEGNFTKGEATSGIVEFLMYLCVLLSLNLGLMNALPIPALDGGRSVFLLIEIVFRKPVPQKVEAMIHFVGLIALLGLIAIITVKDVFVIFK